MLDCRMDGKQRLCYYKGEEMTARNLAKLDDCVVSLSTLTQRISCGINNPERTGWDSIEKCITSKIIKGNHKPVKPRTQIPLSVHSYFIDLMMAMPVNSYKPLIIQSKKI